MCVTHWEDAGNLGVKETAHSSKHHQPHDSWPSEQGHLVESGELLQENHNQKDLWFKPCVIQHKWNDKQYNNSDTSIALLNVYLIQLRQGLEVVVLTEVQKQSEQTEDLSIKAELQEEPVVVLPYTVIDPVSISLGVITLEKYVEIYIYIFTYRIFFYI